MSERTCRRYSLAFQRQVVLEIESGRFASQQAAREHYEIGGAATIPAWLRKFGKNHLLAKVVRVQAVDESGSDRSVASSGGGTGTGAGPDAGGESAESIVPDAGVRAAWGGGGSVSKKVRWEAVHHASETRTLEIASLCQCAGMSRANYYKMRCHRQRLSIDEPLVLELVRNERARQPRLGTRKLLGLIRDDLEEAGVCLGRDRFFELLDSHDLLIHRQARAIRTTQGRHGFYTYPNIAKTLVLTRPNQLWVSDITYLRTLEGFVFLSLVTDAFSRMIVGFDCDDSLEMHGALRALQMAKSQRPQNTETMHHSDRGIQYCCHAYIEQLNQNNIQISMTEKNHCYENAKAERLNGILKQEYGLGQTFAKKTQAFAAAREAVPLYNEYRPHGALQYRFPIQVHQGV